MQMEACLDCGIDFGMSCWMLEEYVTVANVLIDALYMLELNQSGFVILIALTLLIKIV